MCLGNLGFGKGYSRWKPWYLCRARTLLCSSTSSWSSTTEDLIRPANYSHMAKTWSSRPATESPWTIWWTVWFSSLLLTPSLFSPSSSAGSCLDIQVSSTLKQTKWASANGHLPSIPDKKTRQSGKSEKNPMTSSCLSAYPSSPVTKLWPASWTLVKLCPVNFWHLWHPIPCTSFWLSDAMHVHFFPPTQKHVARMPIILGQVQDQTRQLLDWPKWGMSSITGCWWVFIDIVCNPFVLFTDTCWWVFCHYIGHI